MIILGIDPGTNILGYSILETNNNKLKIIDSGVLNLKATNDHFEKLKKILQYINKLIDQYNPNAMSIESPFYGKNIQSMLKLGRAQGVAIAGAINRGLDVVEYSPRLVKQSVTGNGNASKEQVAMMVKSIIGLKQIPETFDETDAIAVALCYHYQQNKISSKKSYMSWNDFISKNPDKLNN